ncbi:MAG: membrane dipeptidase [Gemmatimonadota bacterium]|nr:membrane dipeptidase [Gemmatimonadota bacterium]
MPEQPMLIIDGHLDLAFNALHHRRDLTQDVHVLREREDPKPPGPSHPDSLRDRKRPESTSRGTATVSLPQMRQGRVGIALSTIMCRVQMPTGLLDDGMRTQEAAHSVGQSHLYYYKALEREGQLRFIRDTTELDAAIAAWQNPDPTTPIGLILSMESADPILDPEQVSWWWEQGLRSVGLTHFGANTWGHGTGTRGGLYADAYPLLDALAATNIALDLTHASDLVFWQLLDYWSGPVHASHCNCRALIPGQRHLSDEMIQAIAERGGVIGAVFAEFMLNPEINFDDPATYPQTARRSMSAVVDHIDHICQLVGNCDHVAIGSDLDGGFGREMAPIDYDTIADLQRFLDILDRRGYSTDDIAAIAHGNLSRFFRQAWEQ